MAEVGDKPKKKFKKKASGVKAKKKKEKGGKVDRHNPRATTFSGGVRSVQRRVQFTLDKKANKERAPKIDKTPEVPPPFVVVVQGPPGVGKTTLVKSLVRHYSKQRLLEMRGPITLVSGRQRRLTIIECPQEMSAMLDLAKVADLVLLLVDGSYGFELETFEFINVLQTHGFPKVIGVLTHLDSFKETKSLRKVKKTMKHRFWTELYDGAKLFYLSGLQYGRYHQREVQNLARFIAVTKCPVLSWRQSHPYMIALRWEDQTDPTAPPGAPRRLDLYGYVYGGRVREGGQAHLPGAGDFPIAQLKALIDPCPPPMDVEAERNRSKPGTSKDAKPKKKNALRSLAERHRVVYAPSCDIGSITIDDDAMYINVPEHQVGFTQREEGEDEDESELPEAVRLVRKMQSQQSSLDHSAASRPDLRLVGGATVRLPASAADGAGDDDATAPQRRPAPDGDAAVPVHASGKRKAGSEATGSGSEGDDEGGNEDDEEEEDDDDDDDADQEQDGVAEDSDVDSDEAHRREILARARKRFERVPRLEDVVYSGARTDLGDAGGSPAKSGGAGIVSKPTDHNMMPLFEDEEEEEDAAPAGGGSGPGAGTAAGASKLLGNLGDVDGLDTARMPVLPGGKDEWDEERKEALKARKFITGGWSSAEEDEGSGDEAKDSKKGAAAEDAGGGEHTEGPSANGAKDTESATLVGNKSNDASFTDSVPISTFVRVRLEDVPAACVAEMRSDRPIILGGLLAGETRLGMVQLRVKRHRWHPKLLKSGDALLVSAGWRRFQTVPTFSLEDRGEKRMRFLKYTLEHAHCTMTFYGPALPPNTGALAFRSWDKKVGHFRVCATGGVLESAPNFDIKKKLKLVGAPYKIFKNTAFIKNMFNSDLEVSKYKHAKLQTVSGIRGEIKKAEGISGNFRATFEDRILMSDIVVCKCWINVAPKQFYHPVIDVARWRPAKLIGELRAEAGVPVPNNADSQYGKQFVRPERKFNPLRIPKGLEKSLPFKTKPKNEEKKKRTKLEKKTAIVSSERERSIRSLLDRLYTVRKQKQKIRTETSQKKRVVKEKRDAFIQAKRDAHQKEAKKKRHIKEGMEEVRKRKAMKLD